jgi:O-acetylhomoserine/O-acetylserine sulfhydrylase-like pyridoxal-dependent enzyme
MPSPAASAPDHSKPFETSFGTKAVHAGNGVDAETGAIRRPILMANSYARPAQDRQYSSEPAALAPV